jgi:hypothetical protein
VIEDTLDEGLPRAYTPELYVNKWSSMFMSDSDREDEQ